MTEIIAVEEGQRLLAEKESFVAEQLRTSEETFTAGIIALYEIQQKELWRFAKDEDGVVLGSYENATFEKYLYLFCRRNGISRSSLFHHLRTVRTWTEGLGLILDDLREIGVKRAEPTQKIAPFDGRTGKLKEIPASVVAQLPPGRSVQERLRRKVEEVLIHPAEPLDQSDVRKALTVDAGIVGTQITAFLTEKGGIDCVLEGSDHDYWRGTLITDTVLSQYPNPVKDWVLRRLSVHNT